MTDGAVYLGSANGFLQTIDVRIPNRPLELGRLVLPVHADRLQVSGTPERRRALLSNIALAVVDVTDPARPAWLGAIPAHGTPHGLETRDQRVYITNDRGFDTIDLAAQPNGPQLQSAQFVLPRMEKIVASGGRLYIHGGGAQLLIGDTSRSPVPTRLSRLWSPEPFGDFAANGDWVYLPISVQGVMACDVSDPNKLVIRNPVSSALDPRMMIVQRWRDKRYFVSEEADCFYPWDMRWGAVGINDITEGDAGEGKSYMKEIDGPIGACFPSIAPAIAGDALYAALDNGLNVFNMNATYLGPAAVLPWGAAWLVGTEDRLIAGQNGGWSVYNVADPTAPTLLATHLTGAWKGRPEFVDGLAWVLDKNVVRVIDVSNFKRPTEVAHYAVSDHVVWLTVSGHHAYVSGAGTGLWVLEYRPGLQWLPLVGR